MVPKRPLGALSYSRLQMPVVGSLSSMSSSAPRAFWIWDEGNGKGSVRNALPPASWHPTHGRRTPHRHRATVGTTGWTLSVGA